jgi:ubiquinone/menaquinone biosynthesis C-methylase UbiE
MIDHFSILAPYYDYLISPPDTGKLKQILDIKSDSWVLDVGGGTGRVASRLDGDSKGVFILDISLSMLKQSKEKNGVIPVHSSVNNLPFSDNSIDRIIVVDALHHFEHPGLACKELIRILKPGGRLVIEEFDKNTWVVKLLALAEKIMLMTSCFFTPDEIIALTQSNTSTTRIVRNGKHSFWAVIEKAEPEPDPL